MGQKPLREQYPSLYNVVRQPHNTVAEVMQTTPLNISFRRSLVGDKLRDWLQLVASLTNINLRVGTDHFKWQLTKSGQFTVRSMYLHMLDQHPPFRHKLIWKLKIPLEIKIFLWYLQRGVILTKDNLARRNWKGSHKCCFCNSNETIRHLFFDCHHAKSIWRIVHLATGLSPPISISHMLGNWLSLYNKNERNLILVGCAALCWAIWRSRNDIIFDNVRYNSFLQAIFRGAYWLHFWAQLQHDDKPKEVFKTTSVSL